MASNVSTLFHHTTVTPENRGPLVNVLAWFLVIVSCLTVFTRIATKWLLSHKVNLDDGMILVSLALSVGQTVASSIGVHNGLGQHIETLSGLQIILFQKALYVSNILWLASQCFSKLSVAVFIREISPGIFNERSTLGILVGTVTWCTISIIVLVFQCHAPQVWKYLGNTCINRKIFWDFANGFNLILDLSLVLLPLAVVWNLQISLKRKIVVVGCFASRLLTMISVVSQIVVSTQRLNSSDATFDFWASGILMSVSACLAIVTACVPYLKPFMDGLESGMIRSDYLLRRAGVAASKSAASGYSSHLSKDRKSPQKSANKSLHREEQLELDSISRSAPSTTLASVTASGKREGIEWDAESHSSETQFFKQVKTWTVMSSESHVADERSI